MNKSMEFEHFINAQAPVYEQVLRELKSGRKTTHWMWFIFPQLRGLGHSPMAQLYAIDSLDQAARYLQHAILGSRLCECTQLTIDAHPRSAEQIFGYIDCMKFRSSMTLFSLCSPPGNIFEMALAKFYAGEPDALTVQLLGK